MVHPCRVERIEEPAPASHADFLFRTVIYRLTRLSDGRAFRIRTARRPAWRPGEVVSIKESELEAAAI